MTKKNSQSCQYALNKFKVAELSLKSKLDHLQTAINQQKSFRSLTLFINKAKANVDELKKTLDAVLKESPNSSSTSSAMERYSNLLSRLEKFEHEIDSSDDDGLLSKSSTRIRDEYDCQISNLTEMLTINERDSRSKQPRTFIILQQNTTFTTETGETITVFV